VFRGSCHVPRIGFVSTIYDSPSTGNDSPHHLHHLHHLPECPVSRKAIGTLLVCVSACAFGTFPMFAQLADRTGIGPVSLLFFRFSIAAAILACIALVAKSKLPKGRLLSLIGLGGLYIGQSFTYIQALRNSDPITASLLLYLYPALVAVGSILFLHEKLTRPKLIALTCALLGAILIIGPVSKIPGVAVIYGLGTATFYATYLVCGKRVLRDVPAITATLVILTTAAIAYGIAAGATGVQLPHESIGWVGVVGLALVATVIAIGALLLGLERVSPVEASSLSALEPLVGAAIAVSFLGRTLHIWHVLGGALVIVAVLVLARASADDG
jgi:drug/metabolite transporter (DMT)-like permease